MRPLPPALLERRLLVTGGQWPLSAFLPSIRGRTASQIHPPKQFGWRTLEGAAA